MTKNTKTYTQWAAELSRPNDTTYFHTGPEHMIDADDNGEAYMRGQVLRCKDEGRSAILFSR